MNWSRVQAPDQRALRAVKICYLGNAASLHTQRWAAHFAGRGHAVTVVSFQRGEIPGVEVRALSDKVVLPAPHILTLMLRARAVVRALQPDILHAHYVTSYGLAGAVCDWRPWIAQAWGSDLLVMPERSVLYRAMVKWSLSRADCVISVADHMTHRLVERGYCPPGRIVTLKQMGGVDTDRFRPDLRRRPLEEGVPVVVSTRQFDPLYDLPTLIRAIPTVLASRQVRFLLAGEGKDRLALEQLAARLGVQEAVEFLGRVPHERMPSLLSQADLYVTTAVTDGGSVSLGEAMACGALPVGTDIPANREWIEGGRNGFLFPVGNAQHLAHAILEALARPEWRREAAAENWKMVCRWASWATNMQRIETLYQDLVEAQGR